MSVVVPAHDEASVIGRLLSGIVEGDPDGRIEIVVAANGCTDATAAVAASVSPRIRVLEVDRASKIAGLNAGDAAATAFPRAYVDADVMVTATALLALADVLDSGAMVASPRLTTDTTDSSWAVRSHYRIWALSEYRAIGHIGSGVYAVSASGRARWGTFPEVIADDRFVQQLFLPSERASLADEQFTVRAPRTLGAQMRRATRISAGNRELPVAMQNAEQEAAPGRYARLMSRVLPRPQLWPALLVYCYGYGVPLLRARMKRDSVGWNRDETVRA